MLNDAGSFERYTIVDPFITTYSFPFPVSNQEDVHVYIEDLQANQRELGEDEFDVFFPNDDLMYGGTVSLLFNPPIGYTLIIQRETPRIQDKQFDNQDKLEPAVVERSLDHITMILQEIYDKVAADFDASTIIDRINALENSVNLIRSDVTNNTNNISTISQNIVMLQNSVSDLSSELSSLEDMVSGNTNSIAIINGVIDGIQADIDDINTEISIIRQEIDALGLPTEGEEGDILTWNAENISERMTASVYFNDYAPTMSMLQKGVAIIGENTGIAVNANGELYLTGETPPEATDHNALTGRDSPGAHPLASIYGSEDDTRNGNEILLDQRNDIVSLITPNNILGATTITSSNIDLNLVYGINGNFTYDGVVLNGPPGVTRAFAEIRADKINHHTLQRLTADNLVIYQRYSNFVPGASPGVSNYTATLVSGSTTITDVLIGEVEADGSISMKTEDGSQMYINAIGAGISASGTLEITIPKTGGIDFDTNGFSLTIAPQEGLGTESISVSFSSSGIETITSSVAETIGISRIRYLSGQMLTNSSVNSASINIAMSWLNSSGTPEWPEEWSVISPDSETIDTTARAAAATAQSTADSALAVANSKANVINYSTTPVATGRTFSLNNLPTYIKVIAVGALPKGDPDVESVLAVPHGVTINRMVSITGIASTENGDGINLPYIGALVDGAFNVQLGYDSTNVYIRVTNNMTLYTNNHVIIEYT